MTARELAEKLMEHPDDLVFIPMPEYSSNQECTGFYREPVFERPGHDGPKQISEFHRDQFTAVGDAIFLTGAV